MKLTNRRLKANAVFIYFICMMLLFLLTACGDNSKGTGSIAFSLSIQEFQDAGSRQFAATCLPRNQARGSVEEKSPVSVHLNSPAFRLSGLARYASLFGPSTAHAYIDCDGHQINEIVAYVYDETGMEIARGGPWSCYLHGGNIRVPAGIYLKLELYAIDICSGEKIFSGEKGGPDDPLVVLPGETKNAGEIMLEPLSSPWELSLIGSPIACSDGYYDDNFATSIAINPIDNSVHIGYFHCGIQNQYIGHATNASGSWETESVDDVDSISYGYASIALDSEGLPHISYVDFYPERENDALFYAIKDRNGSWTTRLAYADDYYYARVALRPTSIAVRSESTTTVADITCILDGEGIFSVLYVSCPGNVGTCSSDILEPGDYASLAHDSNQLAHISYAERRRSEIYINYKTNFPSRVWQDSENLDSFVTEVGNTHTSIALDSQGTAHISYCDMANFDLKYTSGVAQNWSEPETVESGVTGCDHNSIAVDSSGRVHISYYANGELRYATGIAGCWVIHSVDNEEISGSGDVGSYNSIAVDYNNSVHISYYDADNGTLKYATRAIQR